MNASATTFQIRAPEAGEVVRVRTRTYLVESVQPSPGTGTLANEGGGKVILGVTDKRPRQIVGTAAFGEPGRTEAGLYQSLHRCIPVEELTHEGKRVLIIHVPSRAPGEALAYKGAFLMRSGDALVGMSDEQLRAIHAETEPDFSAELCTKATLADLDSAATADFRARWTKRSGNDRQSYQDGFFRFELPTFDERPVREAILNAACDFILDYEEEGEEASSEQSAASSAGELPVTARRSPLTGRARKRPWRHRWPDDIRDEVLARLLKLNAERAKEERLSGAAALCGKKPNNPRAKTASALSPQAESLPGPQKDLFS